MVLERASPRRIAIQEYGHASSQHSLPANPLPRARPFHRRSSVSAIRRSIAKFANACVKLLPSASPPPASGEPRRDPQRSHAAISSPWRIYRIYARPGHLLMRNEQGRILDLGVMKGVEPNLTYRLFARDLQGKGFATRSLLLDDIARRIEAGEVSKELLSLPDWDQPLGADLDRGTHTDVSMKLGR
ncbi:Uncharacterised protein [Achromobacter kerstersii]|uniref:Uncharacterized protein n=1 Tax=Achromobacter kerstersii TaxID=1353890 RepID=A0A6S7AXV0_9BURK|nr:hypothetical protein LMG3441_05732 [Achromobacter kerstersii]CUJ15535.1 Uncharacterised protein [Achromobacter kerstersii]